MNADKQDRRVKKTRKALREGLAELMLKKELPHITVRELSELADIHRATFYTHYKDLYDLYDQMESRMLDALDTIITGDLTHTYDEVLKNLVDYVYDNAKMCRMFLGGNGNRHFYRRLSGFLEEKYAEIWRYETGDKEITEEWRFLVRYHLQGCVALLARWAEGNYKYSKEEITRLIFQVEAGIDSLLYS